MRPSIARYVTACQQILALGVVLAVLAPAASVVSLDVVRSPGTSASPSAPLTEQDEAPGSVEAAPVPDRAQVETAPVEAEVREVAMAAPAADDPAAESPTAPADVTARQAAPADDDHADEDGHQDEALHDDHDHPVEGDVVAVSDVEPVVGYGAVGVTWDSSEQLADDEIAVEVRTLTGEEWSEWTELHYHSQDGPDPDSEEGRAARPGTEPLVVGDVDAVQARAMTPSGTAPPDLTLAVVDPGESQGTEEAAPELALPAPDETPQDEEATADEDGLVLQAAARPTIYSRAQWGMNQTSSVELGKVNGAVIHHTVTANNYAADQVPAMLRSIHSYHTKSRGWRDIGYNFLVDRFGRVWEGRYGGIGKAVVGAQATGYNHLTFGISGMGNYDVQEPTAQMMEAYAQLIAWKLQHHGVAANSSWKNGSRTLSAIVGHRDVGSTACPGRYIYNKLPSVRTRAAALQGGSVPAPNPNPGTPAPRAVVPAPKSNLVGTPFPDIVMRRKSDSQVVLVPTEGLLRYTRAKGAPKKVTKFNEIVASPDLTGDGRVDLVVRRKKDGAVLVRPGRAKGTFGKPALKFPKKFRGFTDITAVGDINGDGRNDLVARRTKNKSLHLFLLTKKGNFKRVKIGSGKVYDLIVGTGDLSGDGRADLVLRDTAGRLWLRRGLHKRKLAPRVQIPGSYGQYNVITGFGDFNGDGRADLLARVRGSGAAYVLPGNGRGGVGHPHGPLAGFKNLAKLSGGGTLVGGAGPDLVGRNKKGRLVIVRHIGRYDTGRPVVTNLNIKGTDILLNAGDWTGDGIGDLIIRRANNGRLRVRPGLGGGNFGPAKTITKDDFRGREVFALGDLNGDGRPDLLSRTSAGVVQIHPSNKNRNLGPAIPAQAVPTLRGVDLSPYDWVRWTTDPMLGSAPGLLVRERSTGRIYALLNDGKGALKMRRFLSEGFPGYDLFG